MQQQSSLLIQMHTYRVAQNTQRSFDGLWSITQRLKAACSAHMNKQQLKKAFALAQELEQKAKDIRKAIAADIKEIDDA